MDETLAWARNNPEDPRALRIIFDSDILTPEDYKLILAAEQLHNSKRPRADTDQVRLLIIYFLSGV